MRTLLLLALLLIPLATGLLDGAHDRLPGEVVRIDTSGEPLSVQTPRGEHYRLLGTADITYFPVQHTGTYRFSTPTRQEAVAVVPGEPYTLQTSKGAHPVRAATTPTGVRLNVQGFEEIKIHGPTSDAVRITPDLGERWGFSRTYAVDPTTPAFQSADLTLIATGEALYKCADYRYDAERCAGTWTQIKTLTSGEPYTITVAGSDPAFGEGSQLSEPDACVYSDQTGAGDGDVDVDCTAEVTTMDGGTTTDIQDSEGGGTSNITIRFQNNLLVTSVESAEVTYRYQRLVNSEVGATIATIQVLDAGTYVTACTDSVAEGVWELFTCNLSAYVSTPAEANDIQTRILFDTTKSSKPGSEGTVRVEYAYLSMSYIYNDLNAPDYTAINANPSSPITYDGQNSTFSADWNDDVAVQTVLTEHNFTGSWQNTTTGGGPTYTHTAPLAAGTYAWRQVASDAANNWNLSMPLQTYTVARAQGGVELRLNGTRGNLSIDEGTTITLQGTRTAGEDALTLYENGAPISSGDSITTPRTYQPGTYNLTLVMNQSANYTADAEEWTLTVRDLTPPAAVTGLTNTSSGDSWIRWDWTLPPDSDYSHAITTINGTFYANTSGSGINVTGLDADTLYEISVRTVDTSGNINQSGSSHQARTTTSDDTTAPTISNIQHVVTDSQATITWSTDEPADTLLKYGTTSGLYVAEAYDATDVTSHSITIPLNASTTYYYVVNSTDPALNSNQSSEQTLTTAADYSPPYYFNNYAAVPKSGQPYPVTVDIRVDWKDNDGLDVVYLEHNFSGGWQNSTMSGGPVRHDYIQDLVPGTYAWRSIARDVNGFWNMTMDYQEYVVLKQQSDLMLTIDGTSGDYAVDEDQDVTIQAVINEGAGLVEIIEDGAVLATGTSPITLVKNYSEPGTYNISARLNASTNYSQTYASSLLTIRDATAPVITLIAPNNGKTETGAVIDFEYLAYDNVNTTSCRVLINGTERGIQDPDDGVIAHEHITLTENMYTWTVECTDAAGNTATYTPSRLLNVSFPPSPWLPVIANHNLDGLVTATVNSSDNTVHLLDTGEYITVTEWSESAPSNANITQVEADCEVDDAQRGARSYFEYNTGGGWSGPVCLGGIDTTGLFTCDLYSLGVDTFTEVSNLDLRCGLQEGDAPPAGSGTIDYLALDIHWDLIELPNFRVNISDLHAPETAVEDEPVFMWVDVHNDGVVGASADVLLYDATNGATISRETREVPAGGTVAFNHTWTAVLGSTYGQVIVDPDNLILETNETDNTAIGRINVSLWQTYYGNAVERFLALAENQSVQYNWSNSAIQGNIYAHDADASVSMLNLRALTRDAVGAVDLSDLEAADARLGSTGLYDNLTATYRTGGTLRGTDTFIVAGDTITDVPIVESTNTSSFVTGILWDGDDDTTGGYDGEEDLVFVTRVNLSRPGAYGTYDYELRVPALLRAESGYQDEVVLFLELA